MGSHSNAFQLKSLKCNEPEHSQRKPGIDAILEKLRSQLAKRGTRGICGLGRKFKIMDDDGSSSITADEFTKGMRETGLNLSKTEYGVLFRYVERRRIHPYLSDFVIYFTLT